MTPADATSIKDGMAVHTHSEANDCRTRNSGSLRLPLQIETNIVTNTPMINRAHSPKNMTYMGLVLRPTLLPLATVDHVTARVASATRRELRCPVK